MPESDHSRLCSGGAANMMNRRTVSAPYLSMMSCGSMPLFLDFDIFSRLPMVTGNLSELSLAAMIRPLPSRSNSRSLKL